jgi:hypothetical protein
MQLLTTMELSSPAREMAASRLGNEMSKKIGRLTHIGPRQENICTFPNSTMRLNFIGSCKFWFAFNLDNDVIELVI